MCGYPSFDQIMKNLLSTALAVVLLALVATGIDSFFKIGTLGDAPFWKGLVYYTILFTLIEVVRVGIQKCMEKRENNKD